MQQHHSCHTVADLCPHVPEFIEPENCRDLNPVDYLVWRHCNRWCIITELISDIEQLKCILIDCWAQLSKDYCANDDCDDGYQGQGCPCWISSGPTVCNLSLLFHCIQMKIGWNLCIIVKFSIVSGLVNIYAVWAKNV